MNYPAETLSFLGMPAVVASPAMRRLLELVRKAAGTNATVLIRGESGSGKELVARALHHYSQRVNKPWVDLNCAALPEHLIESELFGHEKGAFSGADSTKQGLFEMAAQGTIFLDEIAELDTKMQTKLLRVLDGAPYFRLGGVKKVTLDVRVLAATNQDLQTTVQSGRFRNDLYHRLAQIEIFVPPLREREDDILPIAKLFLDQQNLPLWFTPEAEKAMLRYDWPGNIRELRNTVMKAALMTEGRYVGLEALPREIRENSLNRLISMPSQSVFGNGPSESAAAMGGAWNRPVRASDIGGYSSDAFGGAMDLARLGSALAPQEPGARPMNGAAAQGAMLEGMEKEMILRVLTETGGHQQRAADLLGISRRTLSRKLKLYGRETQDLVGPVV